MTEDKKKKALKRPLSTLHAFDKEIRAKRYALHSYHGRRPWGMVRQHICHYTSEGDTVLDSFMGSGVTIAESLILKRVPYGCDVSPLSYKLTKATIDYVDLHKFKKVFEKLQDLVKPEISQILKKPEDAIQIKDWYPTDKIPRIIRRGEIDTLDKLFTKRELASVAILRRGLDKIIEEETDESIINLMEITFSASLRAMTRMNEKPRSIINYSIAYEHIESDVWGKFAGKFNRAVAMKKETNTHIGKGSRYFIKLGSATHLSWIDDNSINYVFIDPPYALPYVEAYNLWLAWLRCQTTNKDDMYPSYPNFIDLMTNALKEIARVLKFNAYVTINFVNRGGKELNAMKTAIEKSGLTYVQTIRHDQPSQNISFTMRWADMAHKGDYLITLLKVRTGSAIPVFYETEQKPEELNYGGIEKKIDNIITSKIAPTYDEICEGVIPSHMSIGFDESIHKILEKNYERVNSIGKPYEQVRWSFPKKSEKYTDKYAKKIRGKIDAEHAEADIVPWSGDAFAVNYMLKMVNHTGHITLEDIDLSPTVYKPPMGQETYRRPAY